MASETNDLGIAAPQEVVEQLLHIKKEGQLNMLDWQGVIGRARILGFKELHQWLEADRKRLAIAIVYGIYVREEPS